jgi:hypothetical protein
MTIELNDKSFIVGMWFSSNPITNNDWMACVVRDPENPGQHIGWSRFRYVKDSKIWDSEDEKSWTTLKTTDKKTDDEIIDMFNMMQEHIKGGYPDTDKIILKGGLKDLIKVSDKHSWLNMKQVKA